MIPDLYNPPPRSSLLGLSEPAPWFKGNCTANPQFAFDTVAGRYVVLCFFGSAGDEIGEQLIRDVEDHREWFDDENVCFFGVSIDPADQQFDRVRQMLPGIRYFWDFDRRICRLYGVLPPQSGTNESPLQLRRCTYVLDERLRVLARFPVDDPSGHVGRITQLLASLSASEPPRPASLQAPVLVVPRVFEPDLCRHLIQYYDSRGGKESGFMRDVGGRTVPIIEYGFKRRRDQDIEDDALRNACMVRIHDRLAPEMFKAFQFHTTRMERYIVACYDAAQGGHFSAHRDNTTKGTAHRRFAVSLHLNTGDYEGGWLQFPEFGRRLYSAPVGGAVVFSCSLLHAALPVTRGRRYMFLPFLYDDEAARIRQVNARFVSSDVVVHDSADQPLDPGESRHQGLV